MKQLIPALFVVGAIMTLAGAAVFITGWAYAPYIYTVGAGFIALAQVNTPIKGKSKTLKRLRIQQIFGALALILTGAFMFTTRGNEWIACLTIAAILELYTAFRIPQEEVVTFTYKGMEKKLREQGYFKEHPEMDFEEGIKQLRQKGTEMGGRADELTGEDFHGEEVELKDGTRTDTLEAARKKGIATSDAKEKAPEETAKEEPAKKETEAKETK